MELVTATFTLTAVAVQLRDKLLPESRCWLKELTTTWSTVRMDARIVDLMMGKVQSSSAKHVSASASSSSTVSPVFDRMIFLPFEKKPN